MISVGKRLWNEQGRPVEPPDHRLHGDAIPEWARARIGSDDVVFPGPGSSVLVFTPVDASTARPRIVSAERVQELDLRPVPTPFNHAFDAAGLYLFVAYPNQVVRVELDSGSSEVVAGSTNLVQLFGPMRIACAGAWLAITSSERLLFIRFDADGIAETIWFTCRYGESMTALLDGRILLAGARAGGAVVAVDGDRLEKVASLDPSDIFEGWRGTATTAAWMDGETVCVQASECSEFNGRIEHSTTYVLHGLEAAWTATYGPVAALDEHARADTAARGQLYLSAATKPRQHAMPRRNVSLAYPCAGPTGFGYGFVASDRAGYWNTHIVAANHVRPLQPQWYSRVTYHCFHETEPRLLLASDNEVIEVDLPKRTWSRYGFAGKLCGVAYFGEHAAILTAEQLLRYDLAGSRVVGEYPVEAGDNCELVALLGGQVLLVPCKDGRGLFLGLREQQLVVLGVLEGQRWTGGASIDGRAFLKLQRPGWLEIHNLEAALRAAPVLGEELDLLTEPAVIVEVGEQEAVPEVDDEPLMDAERQARIEAIVSAALHEEASCGLDAGEFEVDGPRQISFVVHVDIYDCGDEDEDEDDYRDESEAEMSARELLHERLGVARERLAAEGLDCELRVRDTQIQW